jgi:hypothetical protein
MATAKKSAAGAADKFIAVSTRSGKTFRRAGIEFGAESTTLSLADLTAEQLEAITAEPALVVVEAAAPAAVAKG